MNGYLTDGDIHNVVARLPKDVRRLLLNDPTLFLAGGFIRETIANSGDARDIDLFGSSREHLLLKHNDLKEKREKLGQHTRTIFTDNAFTLLSPPRMPVQFITRWTYTDALQLIRELDFTVCQAAIWYTGSMWMGVCSLDFYRDLAARRLVYTYPVRVEEAGGSLLRVIKFIKRGYSIQMESLAGVIARLMGKVDFQRTGHDEQRIAFVVKGLLREVDPLSVVDGFDTALVYDENGHPQLVDHETLE